MSSRRRDEKDEMTGSSSTFFLLTEDWNRPLLDVGFQRTQRWFFVCGEMCCQRSTKEREREKEEKLKLKKTQKDKKKKANDGNWVEWMGLGWWRAVSRLPFYPCRRCGYYCPVIIRVYAGWGCQKRFPLCCRRLPVWSPCFLKCRYWLDYCDLVSLSLSLLPTLDLGKI